MKMNYKALVGAVAGLAMAATAAMAAEITGAGATFPFPIYAKWAAVYKGVSGNSLNYQSIGSGGGIAQIKAKTVAFGATDKPLTPKELQAAGLTQFPTVIGGVVPVVNIPGIKAGQLTLDGATLAEIYQGKVARWDDPAIKKLNPGLNLPSKAIAVVHRSDGSGTTFIFATYLSRVSPSWKSDVGADTAIDWPTGIGAKGNEGVAGNVAQISGSIGYVEYAYAKQNHLSHVKMVNKAGQTVEPTVQAFQAAAANADWAGAANNNFYVILVDQPGAQSWPITATTYILVYKNPPDQKATADTLKFFQWGFEKGDQLALGLDYVPLPENAVKSIEASWKGIQGSGM
ncbi:MAG TPA: phosphate ABC transporter substrate-binding protein PstS [Rhizomicrobium sp.]|jgi:phosphate transport system substrate-binding protein|nr:phosphate ABC transporter substrate-binding protein PstS [Rhizomicrobium sp.]